MSIERHLDDGWVAGPAAKAPPSPAVFRPITPASTYLTHEADATAHDGTYMAVRSYKNRNEVQVTIAPPGAWLSFDLSLENARALAEEIGRAVIAGQRQLDATAARHIRSKNPGSWLHAGYMTHEKEKPATD